MYQNYNDQQLLEFIYENQEEALEIIYKKYEPLIHQIAKHFYPYCKNAGLELNDLIQEGMLGLTNAISHYQQTKETSFYTFAKTCIERKIISLVISTKRLKYKILNESISFDSIDEEGNEIHYEKFLFDNTQNPEQLVFSNEQNKDLVEKIKSQLTDFELQVFELMYHNLCIIIFTIKKSLLC